MGKRRLKQRIVRRFGWHRIRQAAYGSTALLQVTGAMGVACATLDERAAKRCMEARTRGINAGVGEEPPSEGDGDET